MESTNKPFDLRSVPIQPIVEPVKNIANLNVGLPQRQTDLEPQRDNTYNGKLNRKIYLFMSPFNLKRKIIYNF
jgi:hypothetical protein